MRYADNCKVIVFPALSDNKRLMTGVSKLFYPIIQREADDDRNFVKKAVNWALRNIGKRNTKLNEKTIQLAQEILTMDSQSATWIARDALRELRSEKIQEKLKKNKQRRITC